MNMRMIIKIKIKFLGYICVINFIYYMCNAM